MYVDIIAKSFFKLVCGISLFSCRVISISGISNVTTSMRSGNIHSSIGPSTEALGSLYILKALLIKGCLGDNRR